MNALNTASSSASSPDRRPDLLVRTGGTLLAGTGIVAVATALILAAARRAVAMSMGGSRLNCLLLNLAVLLFDLA
ncbi:hypothetical protein V8C86DRAFT_2455250, partial [Haematococcus lacustris]